MPTYAEWTELMTKCTWTREDDYNGTGVSGRIVTSSVEGYKDKSIFLPLAGSRYSAGLGFVGSRGYYWSSSLFSPGQALDVFFDSDNIYWYLDFRYYGQSVRPVYED